MAIDGERFVAIGPDLRGTREIDLRGRWIAPGFVQTHVHLVQTLFRGLADDLPLLDWLRHRIWPLERAHDAESVYASARLGITELLLGGTTALLDMATVDHTDEVFRAAEEAGIRLWCGKAMMDLENEAGLSEPTERSLASACALAERWHGKGRLRYAFAPRFVPSCSEALLRGVATEARRRGCLIHSHASENPDEVALVRRMVGRENIAWLHHLELTGADVVLAHCIHLDTDEVATLAHTRTRVAHCPSSNLKLASGLCRVPELLAAGVHVSLGADGAPCNNRLDAFTEMRLAALIQGPRLGAGALPAPVVFRMATGAGAQALGLEAGEIAPGRLADFSVLDPGLWESGDPQAAMVYALDGRAVVETWIGGAPVAGGGKVAAWDTEETLALARAALARTRGRAGLGDR